MLGLVAFVSSFMFAIVPAQTPPQQVYPHPDWTFTDAGYYIDPDRTCNCNSSSNKPYTFRLDLINSVTYSGNCVDGWCQFTKSMTVPNEAIKTVQIPPGYCLVRIRVELQGTPGSIACPPGPCPTGTFNVTSHICHGQFEACPEPEPVEIG